MRSVEPAVSALGAGALLASGHAVVVGPDVDTWLQTLAPPGGDGHRGAGGDGHRGPDGDGKPRRG